MRLLRNLHKWLGLIVAAQLILWTVSGLTFSWLDHHEVMAQHSVRPAAAVSLRAKPSIAEPAVWLSDYEPHEVNGITLLPLLEEWFYRVQLRDRTELRRADTGQRFEIGPTFIAELAKMRYAGDGALAEIKRHESTLEARDEGAVWQARFNDASSTSLYFSAQDARFIAARNDTWRIFDVFWMLHTMDYRGRDNFNNPLVIFMGTGALWLGLSGFILLFRAFRAQELNPIDWVQRGSAISLQVSTGSGAARRLDVPSKPSFYEALQASGIDLPSNCGGGGSCGLCVVRFANEAPEPTAEEVHFIGKSDLDCGFRLACRHAPTAAQIELPASALEHREWTGTVTDNRQLTPTIREIRLRVPEDFTFRAGDYVQIAIPEGANKSEMRRLRRAYSMANYPGEHEGEIVLNVRLASAPPNPPGVPSGSGSTFLFHTKPGDTLRLYGPFGTFHASDTGREMVLIGGGAGMAPLRAILLDELHNRGSSRRVSFWYGARDSQEMFYEPELENLARRFGNFSWHPTISQHTGGGPTRLEVGFVHEIFERDFLKRVADPTSREYYLCGPPVMLDACRKLLRRWGVPDAQVFFDDFGS